MSNVRRKNDRLLPVLVGMGIVSATAGVLCSEGRRWWCRCGESRIFVGEGWSPHTSQHLLDPYSLSHISHGLIIWGLLWLCARSIAIRWRVVIVLAAEALWEMIENSTWVIERYRSQTADIGYSGDSILNSMADLACCGLGMAIAARFGWKASVTICLLLELIMLVWIRDSLALNVIMLVTPIDSVRQWQMGH